jgi:hypothetical protein
VKLNRSVWSAAQLSRLPGTMNRKGDGSDPERPHRLCRVLQYPEVWTPVTEAQVNALAQRLGFMRHVDRKFAPGGVRPALVDDIAGAMERFCDEYPEHLGNHRSSHRNGDPWFFFPICPSSGTRHSTSVAAMFVRGDVVCFHCFSGKCEGVGIQELKAKLFTETGKRSRVKFYIGGAMTIPNSAYIAFGIKGYRPRWAYSADGEEYGCLEDADGMTAADWPESTTFEYQLGDFPDDPDGPEPWFWTYDQDEVPERDEPNRPEIEAGEDGDDDAPDDPKDFVYSSPQALRLRPTDGSQPMTAAQMIAEMPVLIWNRDDK